MIINLVPDTSVASAPAGFAAAIRQAADMIAAAFSDPTTVNISFGYGTIGNVVNAGLTNTGGALGGFSGHIIDYATVRGWLAADATSALDATAIASLPLTDAPLPSHTGIFVGFAQEKALGHFTGPANNIDGEVGFGTAMAPQFLLPVALHELTHALGRVSEGLSGFPTIMDLFRFDAAGHYQWTEGVSSAAPAYFSVDGGVTALANFSTTSDYGDLTNDALAPNDSYDAFYSSSTVTTLTELDLKFMDALGFDRTTVAGTVSINDVSMTEGNSGSKTFTFTVSRQGGTGAFSVNFASGNGSASAGTDYIATNGTLNFAAGVVSQTVSVTVNGDTLIEANETFTVNLTNATNGATITGAQGQGTIVNDDVFTLGADVLTLAAGGGRYDALAGNDVITGSTGNDIVNGGAGSDTMDYSAATGPLYIDLRSVVQGQTGGFGTDQITSIENLIGGTFADILVGIGVLPADPAVLGSTLQGGDGDDGIYGLVGANLLVGGAGNDYIAGGSGDDVIYGGDANGSAGDTGDSWLGGGAGNDTIHGNLGDDRIDGGSGNDMLFGDEGNDIITGGSGNDTISGGIGNDYLYGEAGDDIMNGDSGNDSLYGGDGNDALTGGQGLDYLIGGLGNDSFIFSHADFQSGITDNVMDFHEVAASDFDRLNLQGIASNYSFANVGADVRITDLATGGMISVRNFTVAQLSDQITYF